MNSYRYIIENFLSFDQLLEQTGATVQEIETMIEAKCLPDAAYKLTGTHVISSVFGEYTEDVEQSYFPKSYIVKVKDVLSDTRDYPEIARANKQEFYSRYRSLLVELEADRYGFKHLFDESGRVFGTAAMAFLDQEWAYYLDGVYGLCTNSASIEEIAMKEAMIARIQFLTSDEGSVDGLDVEKLKQAVDQLDMVSAMFAPHELPVSSREKYINALRRQYFSESEKE